MSNQINSCGGRCAPVHASNCGAANSSPTTAFGPSAGCAAALPKPHEIEPAPAWLKVERTGSGGLQVSMPAGHEPKFYFENERVKTGAVTFGRSDLAAESPYYSIARIGAKPGEMSLAVRPTEDSAKAQFVVEIQGRKYRLEAAAPDSSVLPKSPPSPLTPDEPKVVVPGGKSDLPPTRVAPLPGPTPAIPPTPLPTAPAPSEPSKQSLQPKSVQPPVVLPTPELPSQTPPTGSNNAYGDKGMRELAPPPSPARIPIPEAPSPRASETRAPASALSILLTSRGLVNQDGTLPQFVRLDAAVQKSLEQFMGQDSGTFTKTRPGSYSQTADRTEFAHQMTVEVIDSNHLIIRATNCPTESGVKQYERLEMDYMMLKRDPASGSWEGAVMLEKDGKLVEGMKQGTPFAAKGVLEQRLNSWLLNSRDYPLSDQAFRPTWLVEPTTLSLGRGDPLSTTMTKVFSPVMTGVPFSVANKSPDERVFIARDDAFRYSMIHQQKPPGTDWNGADVRTTVATCFPTIFTEMKNLGWAARVSTVEKDGSKLLSGAERARQLDDAGNGTLGRLFSELSQGKLKADLVSPTEVEQILEVRKRLGKIEEHR